MNSHAIVTYDGIVKRIHASLWGLTTCPRCGGEADNEPHHMRTCFCDICGCLFYPLEEVQK